MGYANKVARRRGAGRWVAVVAAGVAILAAACAHDLGTFGGTFGGAEDINAAGTIVGYSAVADGKLHAFVRQPGGSLVDLGTGSRSESVAHAINSAGVAVGATSDKSPGGRLQTPFVWTSGGGLVELPLPTGELTAWAVDINDGGIVLINSGKTHHFVHLYDLATGTYTALPDFGTNEAEGAAIGTDGTVVGNALTAGGIVRHAVRWDATTHAIADLDAGSPAPSTAKGINAAGTIVGWNNDYSAPVAYRWSGGTRTTVGPGAALDINDAGVIVGWAPMPSGPAGNRHARLWDEADGVALFLGDAQGDTGSEAWAINASGVAAGLSGSDVGTQRPVGFDAYVG